MMNLQVVLSLLVVVLVANSLAAVTTKKPGCTSAYRCPVDKNPIWVTDGKTCQIFLNTCFFRSENCDRQNNDENALKQVSKEECQKLCASECKKDDNPVCGYYNETKKTFANQCEMEKFICNTGQIISLCSLGPCDEEALT